MRIQQTDKPEPEKDESAKTDASEGKQAAPRASVPPKGVGAFSRPVAASSSQREKRRKSRGVNVAGKITASVRNDGVGELMLYGTIGDDFWGEGITAKSFDQQLRSLGSVKRIVLRVNSGGGDVFEATAIYNQLVKHPASVDIEIEGVAASAATLVSMAGDNVSISANAHWMIHAASGLVWGNARQVRDYLKLLDNADELIRLTYGKRTGLSDPELVSMMEHDNWMTAQEAFDNGFVDEIADEADAEPHVEPNSQVDRRPPADEITDEQLAAMADRLSTLAANIGPPPERIAATASKAQTGSSPQSVDPVTNEEPKMLMPKALRALCVAAGMVATLSDEDAFEWLADNESKVFKDNEPTRTLPKDDAETLGMSMDDLANFLDQRDKRKSDARAEFRKQVDSYLSLAFGDEGDIPAGLAKECFAMQQDGIDPVQTRIIEAKKQFKADDSHGIGVRLSQSQPRDRHLAAIRAGVLVRSLRNFNTENSSRLQNIDGRWERVHQTADNILERHLPEHERPKDWEAFARMPLLKVAEECLLADGCTHDQLRRLSGPNLAMAAMGYVRQAPLLSAGLQTTGSLLEVTRDAVNKSLLAGYSEAPQTWRGPMRQGASVSDFKQIHRVKLGAAGNLPVWNDNTEPEKAKLSNEAETYAVEARAETLSFSWRLIVNDDLDALSRRPQLLGDAAGRTVNLVAWTEITSNPMMADAQSLFLASPAGLRYRSNYTTGSASPTNVTIGAMKAKMRVMRGLNTPEGTESDDILNLMPSYIVAPAALEEDVLKQVLSGADPASGGNSAVYNTSRTLEPVIEPLLDANSEKAWYLFASPSRVDTVEVTFLEGQETPFAHEWMDDATMAQNYTILQTFAAKAIDHRGVQKHKGEA